MLELSTFEKLKPNSDNPLEVEPFEQVFDRLSKALPNFPKCVLEQWTYRHFQSFCYEYWWLEFDKLTFEKEKFNKKQIMNIGSRILDTQDYWGDDFIENPNFRMKSTWLGQYMNKHKTWPKPIIIFDTQANTYKENEKSEPLSVPYHLLEGHMRLAYMRAFIRHEIEDVSSFHDVWLVKK